MKLFFLTDCDPDLNTGGAIIRRGQINYLREAGIEVIVVKPGSQNAYLAESNTIMIKGLVQNSRIYYALESFGIIKDKYNKWINNAKQFVTPFVDPDDILFSTSGGTLATIILGDYLKKKSGAQHIVNYHDPTDFTTLHGGYSRESKFYHINRDCFEKILLKNTDFIITSSESYREVLIEKYPDLKNRSICNYFGYMEIHPNVSNREIGGEDGIINIVYGGNFGPTQSPEILGLAAKGMSNIRVTYVGKYNSNKYILELANEPNVTLLPSMNLSDYLEYLEKNADIGFFSLRNNLTNYCVPSKLFDYINIGLPMIGLVKGDARTIIETKGYGKAADDSIDALRKVLEEIQDKEYLQQCKCSVIKDRENWSMAHQIKDTINVISQLSNRCK